MYSIYCTLSGERHLADCALTQLEPVGHILGVTSWVSVSVPSVRAALGDPTDPVSPLRTDLYATPITVCHAHHGVPCPLRCATPITVCHAHYGVPRPLRCGTPITVCHAHYLAEIHTYRRYIRLCLERKTCCFQLLLLIIIW